jgi:hypothetical protein
MPVRITTDDNPGDTSVSENPTFNNSHGILKRPLRVKSITPDNQDLVYTTDSHRLLEKLAKRSLRSGLARNDVRYRIQPNSLEYPDLRKLRLERLRRHLGYKYRGARGEALCGSAYGAFAVGA